MNDIKRILIDEIEQINRKERRDNKIRFSTRFMRKHPYLFWGMLICYVPVALIMWHAHYFGWEYVVGFTLFVLFMVLTLSFDIRPRYHFKDIDQLDLRVVYNGEWFNKRSISPKTLERLLNSTEASPAFKSELESIQQSKGRVTFFDVFALVYRKPPPDTDKNADPVHK